MKKQIGLFLIIFLFSCAEKIPTLTDGSLSYTAILIDTSNYFPEDPNLGYTPFKNQKISLESGSYFSGLNQPKLYFETSNNAGKVVFDNLSYSEYLLYSEFIDVIQLNDSTGKMDTVKVGVNGLPEINTNRIDTVFVSSVIPNLVINEIFYAGSDRSSFYFYDQYVELYNSSKQTKYLDGLMLCRANQSNNPNLEINDYVQALYVFQFPGDPLTGTSYPIEPGEFIVVAGDALDHSLFVDAALDLSHAGWEFYNPYAGEPDNPADNVINILPERGVDFLINLSHNAIILADGSEWEYGDFTSGGTYQFVHIPIENVIDAVEYSSNSESTKQLTRRLDAGFAGVGMSKYSGKSVERRIPGFDTNNSRLDFVILNDPTPGF
jgi:uncharacterized protein DUF4876